MSSSRLLSRLILLALVAIVCIAALHVIAWALVPLLWMALAGLIVVLALRRRRARRW
jgi:hypothetical protein